MSKSENDPLFLLIKSLNKSEKRHFSLYVGRMEGGKHTQYLALFRAMDAMQFSDEEALRRKLKLTDPVKHANLKRHLFRQIMISLRLIHTDKHVDNQIREQIDYARILYARGMYMQSLRLLENVKSVAVENHQDILHLEILEFQKLIETRHITRSRQIANKMEQLLEETARRSAISYSSSVLSNLTIQIHGWYIERGHALSDNDRKEVANQFLKYFPSEDNIRQFTFFEKINVYQARSWFYYILLDLTRAAEQAEKWVNTYRENPGMLKHDPDLYLRGLYYLLTFLYLGKKSDTYSSYHLFLKQFVGDHSKRLPFSTSLLAFQYSYLATLNQCFLDKQYTLARSYLKSQREELQRFSPYMDTHRVLLLHYKAAYVYFVCGDIPSTLDRLNEIIHRQQKFLRTDLHFNSRLLHLLCHYELGNNDFATSLLLAMQRAFAPSLEVTPLQRLILKFIKVLIHSPEKDRKEVLRQMKVQVAMQGEDLTELRSIAYLNFPAWLESRIAGKPMKDMLA